MVYIDVCFMPDKFIRVAFYLVSFIDDHSCHDMQDVECQSNLVKLKDAFRFNYKFMIRELKSRHIVL